MAYRFTNTEKWSDAWFADLTPNQKLLFLYLCDNCDIAGFIEYTPKRWVIDTGLSKDEVDSSLIGIEKGLIKSTNGDCYYIRNFLKHQKNSTLTPEKNPAHNGIVKRFNEYRHKFDFEDYKEFIQRGLKGASEGLNSPIGKGIGNGNGKKERGAGENQINETKKTAYAELVHMTIDEYDKLITSYGYDATHRMIEILDNYKGSSGKKYKSDYRAILNWVVKRYEEESRKQNNGFNQSAKVSPLKKVTDAYQFFLADLEKEYQDNGTK